MSRADDRSPTIIGRTALAFAYVCFVLAAATIATSIYVLPLTWKVKLFLSMAALLLSTMFLFMAIAAHLVSRPAKPTGTSDRPATGARSETAAPDTADRAELRRKG